MSGPNDAPDDERPAREADALLEGLFAEGDGIVGEAGWLPRLEADADLRETLVDEALLQSGLRRSFRRRQIGDWAVQRAVTVARRRRLALVAVASGVALGLAVFLASAVVPWRSYARVTAGAGDTALRTGAGLRGEIHELERGFVTVTTRRGARLVIEAPATFRFESPQRLLMNRGRVAADVPPSAKGFTVITPSGEAVDLGTRFAVDVPAEGESEVHVFEGEVVARGRTAPTARSLRGGEAFELASHASRELRTAAFIRGDEARELAAALGPGRDEESRSGLERLRRDPAVIAVIDFEDAAAPAASGGQYRIVQGRWPGSRAAEFARVGDHLPVDVGGGREWPQLTLAAWVRLDAIGAPYQSLYHTDGWEQDNPGQVHWMISQPGVMRLALRAMRLSADAVEQHGFPDSRTSVLGAEGRWMHLAVVSDSDRRIVRFYLNGEFDSETTLAVAPPARLGPARIGNWNRNDRRLSGRIDDLVLLGRPLGDDEIRRLHAGGNPYREAAR